MDIILDALAVFAAVYAWWATAESKTAFHEIEAMIAWLIAAVLFSGGAIVAQLQPAEKEMWRRITVPIAKAVLSVILALGILGAVTYALKRQSAAASAQGPTPPNLHRGEGTAREPDSATSHAPVPPQPQMWAMGQDIVSNGDSKWIVLGAYDVGSDLAPRGRSIFSRTDVRHSTKSKFILIHTEQSNLGSDRAYPKEGRVRDSSGRYFDAASVDSAYLEPDWHVVSYHPLQPSIPQEYWTMFELPLGATAEAFEIRGLHNEHATALVKLETQEGWPPREAPRAVKLGGKRERTTTPTTQRHCRTKAECPAGFSCTFQSLDDATGLCTR